MTAFISDALLGFRTTKIQKPKRYHAEEQTTRHPDPKHQKSFILIERFRPEKAKHKNHEMCRLNHRRLTLYALRLDLERIRSTSIGSGGSFSKNSIDILGEGITLAQALQGHRKVTLHKKISGKCQRLMSVDTM